MNSFLSLIFKHLLQNFIEFTEKHQPANSNSSSSHYDRSSLFLNLLKPSGNSTYDQV
jgi:hypothetical protein